MVVVTAEFEPLAKTMSRHLGHPGLRTLVLPYPLEGLPTEELIEIAADAYPRLLELIGVR